MNTREQAWIYQQEQPDDIIRTGKMKREPKGIGEILMAADRIREKFSAKEIKENIAFENLTEKEKDAMNEQYLSQNNL